MRDVVTNYNSDRDYVTSPHLHNDFMFLIPEKGIMKVRDEEKQWSTACAPRQFLVVPPRQAHSTAALVSDQRHLVIYADVDMVGKATADLFGDARLTRNLCSGIWAASAPLLFLSVAKQKLALSERDKSLQIALIDQSLLLECISIAVTTPSANRSSLERHGAALVKQVMNFVENSFEEMPALEEIASHFGVSKRHLTRTFADITGQSILSYVQKVRIERSKQLLRHTRLSMIEIAQRVGFQSASHFAEIFRRFTEQAPKDWRRSSQQTEPATPTHRARGGMAPSRL